MPRLVKIIGSSYYNESIVVVITTDRAMNDLYVEYSTCIRNGSFASWLFDHGLARWPDNSELEQFETGGDIEQLSDLMDWLKSPEG